ncbi:MAG: PQQ-dependent sugar dehydrogenase, partial [Parvularculaceae bacterium]|nr:PQQ-dependent sugar dehydrogenase [Parvularculaceae bacterium]
MRAAWAAATVVFLAACSDGGGGSPAPPPPANTPPTFTSAAAAQVNENVTGAVYRATATDAQNQTITFALSGGADAGRFSINGATGDVSFLSPPDFEAPTDQNGDNIYNIVVSASDGQASSTLAVAITVRDVVDNYRINRIANGLAQPLFLTGAGDGSSRAFIVEKGGRIRVMDTTTGVVNATPFLDVSTEVSTTSERGLLGLAFAPNYLTSGVFYVYLTNLAGNSEVRRYRVSSNPQIADAASADLIMTFTQPAANHNGGWMGFGADGFLYIASGDGGGNTSSTNPAQITTSLLGKILRVDVAGDDFPTDASRDYRIPSSNPFATSGGAPEVYASGLRNPWRCSFDPATNQLFIGDVGENAREEINIIPSGAAGRNFGWVRFEGTQVFLSTVAVANHSPPVLEYLHGSSPFGPFNGNSVTGGVVNRGPVEALQGEYIFGDFISGNIWSVPVQSLQQGT